MKPSLPSSYDTSDVLAQKNRMNKFLIVLSLAFLGLTGCSRLDIAFNWADTYIASKVDDYFDISSKQSKDLKHDIQKDLQGIKSEVLPQWIARLKGIQEEVTAGTLHDERIAFYFSLFMKDVEQFSSRFSGTAVDFISTTNSQQLDYFAKAFHKKNQEDLEKAQNTAKLKKDYRDKYFEWIEMFVGSLNTDQKKMVEDNIALSPFPAELKAKNKEYIFEKFMAMKGSPEEMKNFVKDYYSSPEKYDMPEFREAYTSYQKNLQKLVVNILDTLSPDQKARLKDNLTEKMGQLQKIASR